MAEFIPYNGQHSCADIDTAIDRAALVPELQTAVIGKQNELTTAQLAAANSGIDSDKVAQIAGNKVALAGVIEGKGKNLARWVSPVPTTLNGVTFTPQNNGSIVVTSAAAASARAVFDLMLDVSDMQSGKYVLSGCPEGGKNSGGTILYDIYIMDYTTNARVVSGEDTGTGLTFDWTIDKTHKYALMIDIRSGTNVGSKTFYPMLSLAVENEISPAFEQYQDANKVTRTIVLEVGTGKRFTSLLNALRYQMDMWDDHTKFIINVAAGTYDISGAAALIANESIDPDGLFIMPNTELIGEGSNRTIINFIYAGSDDTIQSEVSGMNAPYTCKLQGFTLNVKNLRYAIHSDTALASEESTVENPKLRDTTIELDDVNLVHQGYSDGVTPTYRIPACWGAGIWDGCVRIFRNCTMKSTAMAPWFNHDRVGLTSPSRFVFEDCTFVNVESSIVYSDSSALASLCFISWGSGVKHKVSINRTFLNKFMTLRVLTSMGNTSAKNDYDVTIGQPNTIVFEADVNSTRDVDNYRTADCITSTCQTAAITAYTPVSSKRRYWIHAYDATDTIRGIALNSADVGGIVRVQIRGYIPLTVLTDATFPEGTLLGWNGSAYVEDTTHPLLRVVGGNLAQIVANGQ